MNLWNSLLDTVIDAPWFLVCSTALAALLLAGVLYRRGMFSRRPAGLLPVARRLGILFLTALVGALLGLGILWYCVGVGKVFGESLLPEVWFWVPVAFAGILLCLSALRRSGWRRRVLAGTTALAVAATSTLQINAAFGLNPTVASLLNISTEPPLPVTLDKGPAPASEEEPYKSWSAPSGMPHKGSRGRTPVDIPATHSGFKARWPGLYLPPAALVKNAPRLPFMIMMMGQPGFPGTTEISEVANAMAARHNGLAPVILVVDQLGEPTANPLCLDTARGRVESYLIQDVVPWVREHLPVLGDRRYWTVAGYSNGGVCAAYFGAKYPELFGSFISVSGEEYQGAEHREETLAQVFHGNQKAYDAVKPRQIMLRHGNYADSVAVYTAGGTDQAYLDVATRCAATAREVGMQSHLHRVPDANHGRTALTGGLNRAFDLLYPRWGLSRPR